MDKLKPILAQKFWILFSIVVILPPVGYFMTRGKLAAEIDERRGKLEKSFTDIPAGTGVPNESWSQKLSQFNEQQILHNRRANQELWSKQHERMFWPKDITPIMSKAEYFMDLTEEQKGGQVLFKYPLSYQSQLRALWEIVDPLDDGVNQRDSDKRRKVAFAMADLHHSSSIKTDFEPKFSEIWSAQEDIWLQTELLNAIKRLNANSISQGDAFVKQLGKIQLFGGTKSTGDAGGAAAGVSSGGMNSGETAGAIGLGMGMGFPGQRSEATAISAEINLSEEFAASLDGGGGAGVGAAGMVSFGSSSSGDPSASMANAAGGPKPDVKRYLDYDEKQPYKRRGFYIKLTIDHRKVPDLISELMNSPFPVEIVRVHQVWLSDSGSGAGGAGGPSSGAGGFAGFRPPSSGDSSALSPATSAAGFTESDDGSGAALSSSGGASGRSAAANPGSAAALADPNLAQVTILGVWTLYLPPPPAADAGQPPPTSPVAPAAGVAAVPESTTAPAESAATEAKPAAESTEAAGDENKKPDDSDAPKSEPSKTEKTDSETDSPPPEKTPPKSEPSDKTEPESK